LFLLLIVPQNAFAEPQSAVCRVHNRLPQFNNVGSGTLVDKTDGGGEGLVLTCAHLFSDGVGDIVVDFPNGKSHGAKLVAIDREADLAALAIRNPECERAAVNFALGQTEQVRACGFGPEGDYACAEGAVVGEATNAGQVSVLIGDAVRSGDSGGGVFDAQGNLVAVVWGEANGVTYASSGAPLRKFLDRVLGRRTAFVYACPGGMCPRPFNGGTVNPPRSEPVYQKPLSSPAVDPALLDELRRRIALVEQNKQDRGEYVTRSELSAFLPRSEAGSFARTADMNRLESTSTERHESLLAKIRSLAPGLGQIAGKAATGILGISGPAGWGVLGATTIGGWLVGRLMKRGVGGRRTETFHR
jgi:hypothetical protein